MYPWNKSGNPMWAPVPKHRLVARFSVGSFPCFVSMFWQMWICPDPKLLVQSAESENVKNMVDMKTQSVPDHDLCKHVAKKRTKQSNAFFGIKNTRRKHKRHSANGYGASRGAARISLSSTARLTHNHQGQIHSTFQVFPTQNSALIKISENDREGNRGFRLNLPFFFGLCWNCWRLLNRIRQTTFINPCMQVISMINWLKVIYFNYKRIKMTKNYVTCSKTRFIPALNWWSLINEEIADCPSYHGFQSLWDPFPIDSKWIPSDGGAQTLYIGRLCVD